MSCEEQHWRLVAEREDRGGFVLFPLDVPDERRESLAHLLSGEERARAARFRSAGHGARFQVAHGRLRQLLAQQLGLAPAGVEFAAGPHGKPGLAGVPAESGLRFNLSHSGPVGAVGWSWQCEIGVDVEVWRNTRDAAALVRRYFSAAEATAWEALTMEWRLEAFFNLWTRKEAYVKALGRGLSLPLDSFDVRHESMAGECLLRPSALAADGRSWSIVAPVTGPGISAAVALEARELHIVRVA